MRYWDYIYAQIFRGIDTFLLFVLYYTYVTKNFILFLQQPLVSRHDELRERARQLLEQARNQTKPAGYVSTAVSPIEVLYFHLL